MSVEMKSKSLLLFNKSLIIVQYLECFGYVGEVTSSYLVRRVDLPCL